MKQFSLKEYLEHPDRKVVTGDGRNVRIICTDGKIRNYPIIALVEEPSGFENLFSYTEGGQMVSYEPLEKDDLFFAPEKHEGWVNIYKAAAPRETLGYLMTRYVGSSIWPTEEAAKMAADADDIVTIKIEWEEQVWTQ